MPYESTVADFDLLADLNIGLIADRLTEYTDALVSIQLTKKQADGTYSGALDISQYMTLEFEGQTAVSNDATSYYKTIGRASLTENAAAISIPTIHCHVITGSELEFAGFDYTNYKITVTVILLDSGNRIPVSQASNYVVYTNARILPDFVSQTKNDYNIGRPVRNGPADIFIRGKILYIF